MTSDFDDVFQPATGWAERVAEPPRAIEADGSAPAPADGSYRAFGFAPKDDMETCDIAWWLPGNIIQGQEIQYRFLIRIAYVGDDHLTLMLSDCIIDIEGKNLRDLRKRLARRRVTYIQAYNPFAWPKPPTNEPIIEKIQVLYPGELAAKCPDQQ